MTSFSWHMKNRYNIDIKAMIISLGISGARVEFYLCCRNRSCCDLSLGEVIVLFLFKISFFLEIKLILPFLFLQTLQNKILHCNFTLFAETTQKALLKL